MARNSKTDLVSSNILTGLDGLLGPREDFGKTKLSNLITVDVRDIQGEGFPEKFYKMADAVFLDLPQPWLAIPSAGKTLKCDGTICSFSPCIEQVQRACETLRSCEFTDIRTFEILLRTYEVKEIKMEGYSNDKGTANRALPCKRQCSDGGSISERTSRITVRPSSESRGHTGYLTFARLSVTS